MKYSGRHDSVKFCIAVFTVLTLAGCGSNIDQVKTLHADNVKLQLANKELSTRISALESDNNVLKRTSLSLASLNGSIESNSGALSAHTSMLENERVELKNQNTDLNGKILQLQNIARYDGVWQRDKGDDTDGVLSYKVLTFDSWALLTFNKTTNALIAGKVGTYFVKDGMYQEWVTTPSPAEKDKDNVTQFTIDADGNGMTNGSEHWKRAALE